MSDAESIKKVLVVGSGPIVIGQAAEFDYAGTQACLALKEAGIEVLLLNNNPATIMTDSTIVDHVYFEPMTIQSIEKIFKQEKPDGMIGTLGGQTGLNLTIAAHDAGLFETYGVKLLGTSVDAIQKGEDREKFRQLMIDIDEPIAESSIVETVEEGFAFVEEIGYPVILRPAYTLGGAGGGFAYNDEEFETILKNGLKQSPIHQVLVEKSIKGWKEVEYEVMRDANDTCTIVCNMENMDPVGVHTGDSIVVAPSQTLTDVQFQMLRTSSLKVIRALGVIGGCNIQFALHPKTDDYVIIEVNPRVSRSSALASKATGYPIARIAAQCALGMNLHEIINPITGNTFASFEPALDYIVVKLPRFPFDKFPEADRTLGTQMKATGEVMALDRTFEGAMNKAIRSLEMNVRSLTLPLIEKKTEAELTDLLQNPNDLRLFALAEAMRRGMTNEEIHQLTAIDHWFLSKVKKMVSLEEEAKTMQVTEVTGDWLKHAKRCNISDEWLSAQLGIPFLKLRELYDDYGIAPGYQLVDTCAGEFDAKTPYYYSTWSGHDEVNIPSDTKKILVLGSGPIRIGQGIEFDYCSVHAVQAVQKAGYEAVIMNNNPETVSTDYAVADRLYFEPLSLDDVWSVIVKEQVEGVIVQFGGQTAINLAADLEELGVHVFGTSSKAINAVEDREVFYELLNQFDIDHIRGEMAHGPYELKGAADKLGFPVLIRPSYVIGGQSMFICYDHDELETYAERIQLETNDRCWPLLIDQYVPGKECEVDVITDGQDILIPGIFEHLEKAGVHSGDSVTIFPSITLTDTEKQMITDISKTIAVEGKINGMMNIQFVLHEGHVYVLEVNPRSSRTVPIMSKVTGVPMIEYAVRAQLGEALSSITKETGLMSEVPYYTVKAPVFSATKLKGVDHVLGPEMKSTGEVIGIGQTKEEAIQKATVHMTGSTEKRSDQTWFVSVSDRLKSDFGILLDNMEEHPGHYFATPGTAALLEKKGLNVSGIMDSKEEINQWFRTDPPAIVLNIANQGRQKQKVGFFIRETATKFDVPCYTNLETFKEVTGTGLKKDLSKQDVYPLDYYLNQKGNEVSL
ncbi:carbamoyl-phosphate synthase (glutamine-hydrolyzing) large subunit [Salisediminibacterium selenitireducens]|uniref:Carbamoyl phosphate synthase large chain n=1 Tax=Bacillus selenitireducens (strain ATCC 700615 / DSM 15326 / MLS10) TaxID=439292 RepID=D6XUI3_BACIE|nr:carbamoyl-phosphate synthase (glutamine-hydrolyzing) large subunit [Salisediminibacterium selenitireducens]ADH99469.1 carbamoyl-phosphate synthase, large subunit [[Bacillus] selenitireducens MLS10]